MKAHLPPPALAGFERINRYWDPLQRNWVAKILPGEVYVSHHLDEVISTTLGSCVAACIWDKESGIGGMNHFMLPHSLQPNETVLSGEAGRYGSYAMELLINAILNAGGSKTRLRMKVCGGANLIEAGLTLIGKRNADFVLQFARQDKLDVVAQDLGSNYPRKILFSPHSGRLRIKALRHLANQTVVAREEQYQTELVAEPLYGDVELF